MNYFGLFPAAILMLIILLSFITDGMRIQVISDMHLHEKLLTVEVEKTDTVKTLRTKILEELKGIIKNETGIPQEELSLRYSNELKEILKNQTDSKNQTDISSPEEQSRNYYKKENGLILEDSKRLEEYGIKDDAETIYLELIEFGIFIEHKGATHSFSVFADDFVKSLKEKIKEKLGIPPEEQILTRPAADGHVLGVEEELSKMYYHNIVSGTCLSLKETINFGIFIEHKGKKYSFNVLPDDFVKSLKEKIAKKFHIRPEEQILTRPDGHVLWEQFSQMRYHNIVRGTCLTLNEKLDIKVEYNGNSYTVEVNTKEKVSKLKKKVIKKINECIPKDKKIKELSLKDQQGKILGDDKKTIADYKIQGPLTVENAEIEERKRDRLAKAFHIHS